jgi:DMSO/TMAO reductase YedYZ molybdopterin-dependent catalytic subunit
MSPHDVRQSNTARILNEKRRLSRPMEDDEARRQMSGYTRRGFLVGSLAALTGILGWRWMSDETKLAIYRGAFEFNEKVSQAFYRPSRLAPEFPPDRLSPRRVNGMYGLADEVNTDEWRLALAGLPGRREELMLTLDEIRRLPRAEMTVELKCIEGWSVVVNWAGVRFSDFAAAYMPPTTDLAKLPPYVSLSTPDEKYFVGWDMPSIMHPQTLLAYEMNGAPLLPEHGAPLRLASATKYGIKQIKRIGRIEFTSERPRDFWAQQGYDWYSGH